MGKLEIELLPEERTRLEQKAEQAGLPVSDWARQTLLSVTLLSVPEPAVFITDDGEVIVIPDMPEDRGVSTYRASQSAFGRLWDNPQEDAAWNDMK